MTDSVTQAPLATGQLTGRLVAGPGSSASGTVTPGRAPDSESDRHGVTESVTDSESVAESLRVGAADSESGGRGGLPASG